MALFEYFPNYIWNLSVAIALENGGKIGEIVDMCQPILDAAANGDDAGTGEVVLEPFSGSVTQLPSTTNLYSCSPGARSTTTTQFPVSSETRGRSSAFQPLKLPARATRSQAITGWCEKVTR